MFIDHGVWCLHAWQANSMNVIRRAGLCHLSDSSSECILEPCPGPYADWYACYSVLTAAPNCPTGEPHPLLFQHFL